MSILTRIFGWFYAQSLKLYPKGFRTDFDDEMEDVFTQAARENNAILIFLRELKDLPGSLIHQYWLAIRKEKVAMTTLRESSDIQSEDYQPGTWGLAFLAGLPHLLMGLLIGIGKLFDQNAPVNQYVSIALAILFGLVVIAILVFAWRRGWPLWSVSWYLYGSWVTLAIISLTIRSLNLEESWRYTNGLFFGWVMLCIIGYFVILTKSRLHGLLSVAFLFPLLGVLFLEFVPNPIEGWLAIGLALLAALTTGMIIRLGEFRTELWLVLGVNVVAGLSLAYVGEYQITDLPPGIPITAGNFGNFLELLGLYSFVALGIIALPFLLRGLWNFGRRKLT